LELADVALSLIIFTGKGELEGIREVADLHPFQTKGEIEPHAQKEVDEAPFPEKVIELD
jgi:hypothetical protein